MNAAERRIHKRILDQRDKFIAKLIMLGFKRHKEQAVIITSYTIGNIEDMDNIFVKVAPTSGSVYIYVNEELIGGTWTQEPALKAIVEMLNDPESMSSYT